MPRASMPSWICWISSSVTSASWRTSESSDRFTHALSSLRSIRASMRDWMVESIAMSLLARGAVPCRVRPQWLVPGPAPSARPARPATAARPAAGPARPARRVADPDWAVRPGAPGWATDPASAARGMVRSGLPCGPKMTTPGRVRQILVAARLQRRGAALEAIRDRAGERGRHGIDGQPAHVAGGRYDRRPPAVAAHLRVDRDRHRIVVPGQQAAREAPHEAGEFPADPVRRVLRQLPGCRRGLHDHPVRPLTLAALELEALDTEGVDAHCGQLGVHLVETVQAVEDVGVLGREYEAEVLAADLDPVAAAVDQPHRRGGADLDVRAAAVRGQAILDLARYVGRNRDLASERHDGDHDGDCDDRVAAHTILVPQGEVAEWLKALAC